MMAIGMIFRDLKSIELNVYNTVMQNEENNHPIVPELPEWTQDRVERFLERIHRFSRNDRQRD